MYETFMSVIKISVLAQDALLPQRDTVDKNDRGGIEKFPKAALIEFVANGSQTVNFFVSQHFIC